MTPRGVNEFHAAELATPVRSAGRRQQTPRRLDEHRGRRKGVGTPSPPNHQVHATTGNSGLCKRRNTTPKRLSVARFNTSASCPNERMRLFGSRGSADSADVIPGFAPSSMLAFFNYVAR